MIKVLVVDDDPDVRALVTVWMSGTDFEPVLGADGYQAVQFARAERPDVILLDINMPAAKGFLVHERLKRMPALAHVPIIYMSSDQAAGPQALAAGAARFLAKPLEQEHLMRTLREVYEQSS